MHDFELEHEHDDELTEAERDLIARAIWEQDTIALTTVARVAFRRMNSPAIMNTRPSRMLCHQPALHASASARCCIVSVCAISCCSQVAIFRSCRISKGQSVGLRSRPIFG